MMNESYYYTLQRGLRRISDSLPDFFDASEEMAFRSNIDRVCQLAAMQISEIHDYENRHRSTQ